MSALPDLKVVPALPVDDDGAVFAADFDEIRDYLSGKITVPTVTDRSEERCSVVGTPECNMQDLVVLKLAMDAGDPSIGSHCDAALSPAP